MLQQIQSIKEHKVPTAQQRMVRALEALEFLNTTLNDLNPEDLTTNQIEYLGYYIEKIYPELLQKMKNDLDEAYKRDTIRSPAAFPTEDIDDSDWEIVEIE